MKAATLSGFGKTKTDALATDARKNGRPRLFQQRFGDLDLALVKNSHSPDIAGFGSLDGEADYIPDLPGRFRQSPHRQRAAYRDVQGSPDPCHRESDGKPTGECAKDRYTHEEGNSSHAPCLRDEGKEQNQTKRPSPGVF